MTIQEILEAHRILHVSHPALTYVFCNCNEVFENKETHRAHVAEVLDKHVQVRETQAQVNVLNGVASAWEEMASSGATHLYVLMLRETAKRIGADNNEC